MVQRLLLLGVPDTPFVDSLGKGSFFYVMVANAITVYLMTSKAR